MKLCGKKYYNILKEARKAAHEFNNLNKEIRAQYRVRPYKCNDCKGYHLTSKTQRTRERPVTPDSLTRSEDHAFIKKESEFWEKKFKKVKPKKKNRKQW